MGRKWGGGAEPPTGKCPPCPPWCRHWMNVVYELRDAVCNGRVSGCCHIEFDLTCLHWDLVSYTDCIALIPPDKHKVCVRDYTGIKKSSALFWYYTLFCDGSQFESKISFWCLNWTVNQPRVPSFESYKRNKLCILIKIDILGQYWTLGRFSKIFCRFSSFRCFKFYSWEDDHKYDPAEARFRARRKGFVPYQKALLCRPL